MANIGALAPTLLAGFLIDLIGVKTVAVVIALTLVAGAILGRRIGAEHGDLAPAPGAPAT